MATLVSSTLMLGTSTAPRVAIVVTGLKGMVELKRSADRDFKPLTSTTTLSVGDTLRLVGGATARLLREDAAPETLNGPRTLRIERKPARATEPRSTAALRRLDQVLTESARTSAMAIRTDDDLEPTLLILSPRYSITLDGAVRIVWTKLEGGSGYTLTVLNASEDQVFRTRTTETTLSLPADKILGPGSYIIEATANDANGKRQFDTVRFTVATKAAATSIRDAMASARSAMLPAGTPRLILLAALIHHAQHPEAETELLAEIEKFPDDQTLHLLLAETYRRMRRPVLQLRELKAAGVEAVKPSECFIPLSGQP